ncbi:ESP1 [Candida metapsilosis]|uniref:separase n=1 Tax=Candida metapsilosis TaxID=273372 RepID=A0A8H7ZJQ7_9ASCO|nr:ESP1 [Candida metapsilosis]
MESQSMDSLDQNLLSYVHSRHVQPLTPSRKVNLPKYDVKSLEFSCVKALDGLFSNFDIQNVQSIHIKLQFLYSLYEDNYDQWLNALKKHQLLIVKLFEMKQYDVIYDQLENTHQQISTRLNHPTAKVSLFTIVDGVDIADCDLQLTQIVIAYHFFTLQWLAQGLARNTLPKVDRRDIVPKLPYLFLTTSNQRRWIAKAPHNDKYETNCVKLINAFIKVLEKQKEQYTLEITCLKIKLMDFIEHTESENLAILPGTETFVKDTKSFKFEISQKPIQLKVKQAKVAAASPLTEPTRADGPSQAINDIQLLSTLKATNYDSVNKILNSFSKITTQSLSSQQIKLLDSVTLFCQSNLSPELTPFLKQLYEVFKCHNQLRRVRNVSNLVFKLGKKNHEDELLDLAINYEYYILEHQQSEKNFDTLVGKLRMVDNLSANMMSVLLKACQTYTRLDPPTMSLINKAISTNTKLAHCLNEIEEQFRINMVEELFKNASSCKSHKSVICNAIVQGVPFSTARLSSRLQLSYYNVRGVAHLTLTDPENCDLLASAGLAIAKMGVKGFCEKALTKVYNNIVFWAQQVSQMDEFEMSVLKKAILFLRFNGMNNEVKEITETLLNVAKMDDDFKIFLHFQLCNVSEKLFNHFLWENSLTSLQSLLGQTKNLRFQDVINYKIESIKYYTVNDLETAQTKFKTLVSTLKSRSEFDLSQPNSFSIWDKLRNFLILAKSQFLAAKITVDNRASPYSCILKAIKILCLISKKCPMDLDTSLADEVMWETNELLFYGYDLIIGSLAGLGLSKNIPLYLNEWRKLNDSVKAPVVNQINMYKIQIYGILSKSENFQKGFEDDQVFVKTNPAVASLKLIVNSLLGDSVDNQLLLQNKPTVEENALLQYINQPVVIQQFQDSFTKCISRLNNFKLFGSFPDCVQIFPSITNGELSLSHEAMEVYLELGKMKDDLLSRLQRLEFPILEQKRLYYALSQCVHLISSISAYRGKDMLYHLYFIQNWIKTKPFVDNRRLATMDEKDLIPDVPKPTSMTYHQQLSEFMWNLSLIPANWSIVTIDICELTGDLLLSKLRSDGLPTFVRLSLTRFKQRESIKTLSFEEMKKDFKRLFESNRKSTQHSTTSQVKTIEDRKKWWKTRFTLDYELQELLQHVEKFWFGGFKGIFEPIGPSFDNFKLDLMKILKTHFSNKIDSAVSLNDVIIEAFHGLKGYDRACIDDLLYFLMEILSFHLNVDATQVNFERLHESIQDLINKHQSRDSSEHIVLIPSARCSFFPWESLQFLRSKSVTRMPSVSMLIDVLQKQSPVKKNDVYYLINPGGDLKTSQERFQPVIEKCKTWKGLAGVKPKEDKIVNDILGSKLFVFIGHGGCDQYIRSREMFHATQYSDLPPCLLIGCSSGELQDHGHFEPSGGIFNWINCGSPLVLANLWDVTDKDIDAFTISMFNKWGLLDETNEKLNIAEAVRLSREVCILKYLNGAAPVIYGLPLMTSQR